ncbi:MAG: tetratricopeptide repeat protein [Acidobacteriota bacterium]|nr:tetratricopeptide repeat protein [Acidobacteriota bacterium]
MISSLDQQWKKDPTSRVFFRLAEEYRKGKAYDKAIEVCRAGIEHHPNYLPALICLGRSYREFGLPAEAEDVFARALAAAPDNAHALRGLGHICFEQGRLEEAARYLEMLVLYEPTDEPAQARLEEIRAASAGGQAETGIDVDETADDQLDATVSDAEMLHLGEADEEPEVQVESPAEPLETEVDDDVPITLELPDDFDEEEDDNDATLILDESELLEERSEEGAGETPLTEPVEDEELPAITSAANAEPASVESEPFDEIDLEFARALKETQPESEVLFPDVSAAPHAPAAPPPMSEEDEMRLTVGLKHEKMEHLEAAQHIYRGLLNKYPGDKIVNGHLERVSALLDREKKAQKKARLLSNWLDKIKGVYYVR